MSEILSISHASEWDGIIGHEPVYGQAVTPTKTISEGSTFLGSNLLGQPVTIEPPIGQSQPIKVIRGPKKPVFPLSFNTISAHFLNYLLGTDLTGTADEDIDGPQTGHICYKHRIPDPGRPDSFTLEVGSDNDAMLQAAGCILNDASISIEKEKEVTVSSNVIANNVVMLSQAKQTPTYSPSIPLAGWRTSFKVAEADTLGFTKITVAYNNQLEHTNDFTGTEISSDVVRKQAVTCELDVEFPLSEVTYLQECFTPVAKDVEVRIDIGDATQRKVRFMFNTCEIKEPDIAIERGNKPLTQRIKFIPIKTTNDMISVNRSTLISGGEDEW